MGIFEEIDKSLYQWAREHGLHISTKDRDGAEVRTTLIVDDAGNVYEVWLELLNSKPLVIHYGFRSKRRKERIYETCESGLEALPKNLERVYAQIHNWIVSSGNSRTPVL